MTDDLRTLRAVRAPVAAGVNPLVREFFGHLVARKMTCKAFGEQSGLNPATIANWHSRKMPNVANFEAALNSIGLKLAIVPMEE